MLRHILRRISQRIPTTELRSPSHLQIHIYILVAVLNLIVAACYRNTIKSSNFWTYEMESDNLLLTVPANELDEPLAALLCNPK